MKFSISAAVAVTLLAVSAQAYAEEPAAAAAEEAPGNSLSATATLVSDYVFRGITQSDEHPAVQGSIDYAHGSGFYVGVWASNVDFNDGIAHVEIDGYGGYTFSAGGFDWDAGGTYYYYPESRQSRDHYNYFEGKVAATKDLGFASLTGQANYSPNNFADSGPATYISLGGDAPLGETGFSVQAAAGHQWIDNNANFGLPNYTDWSAGVTYSWQGFDLNLKYTDTNLSKSDCPDGCEARGILSVSRTFE